MQEIIVEKPYRFVPPHRGKRWPDFIQAFDLISIWLRRSEGVVAHECRNVDRLRASLAAGHGIMLAPNHCRAGDPIVMGYPARQAGTHVYAMASWHLFNQGRFNAFAIHKMGGFSLNREGVDRQSINTAIEILEHAERPLVIFPEGAVTRTNDRLHALLDGVAFIARSAAKKRARLDPPGKVVIHPVAIKYLFQGDIHQALDPVLTKIEKRLSWQPQVRLPLVKRVLKLGSALLALKEIEYFGSPRSGTFAERLRGLLDRLLTPLEQEWLGAPASGPAVPRVKALRLKILPEMVRGEVSPEERQRRWGQLADIYLAQQVSCYLPDYLSSPVSVDRLLETVERFEEDLTDRVTMQRQLKAIIDIGEPMEVRPERDRAAAVDPLMSELAARLQAMLNELAKESRVLDEKDVQTHSPSGAMSRSPAAAP